MALFSSTRAMADAPVLQIATGDYAPFTDQNAPDDGLVNNVVREMAHAAGYEVEFTYLPWMRALELTRNARFSATSYWYFQREREADFIHVGPIVSDRLVFFRRADSPLPHWTALGDLGDITIGAVTGYTYTDDFWDLAANGTLRVETAQTDEANMRKLLVGRIDAYPMSEESGRLLISSIFTDAERAQIVIEDQPLTTTEGFLLVTRATADAELIAERLQSALGQIEPLIQ